MASGMCFYINCGGETTYTHFTRTDNAHSYINKGIVIKDIATEDLPCEQRQRTLLNTTEGRGKAQISFYSSFDIGSQSLCATESVHSMEKTNSLPPDFPISLTHCGKHITRVTSSETCHLVTRTQLTHTHEDTCSKTQSTKRKWSGLNKGSKKSGQGILKSILDKPSVLPLMRSCKYCAAKRFYHEPNGFCCSNGEVALISNTTTHELHDLFTSTSKKSHEFQTYIRTYNNTFAFTSIGVKYDKDLCRRNKEVYTFKIQGQVYHYIYEIVPTDTDPSYLQLYFYDTKHEISNRTNQSTKLNSSIVEELINILKINHYAAFFRSLTKILDWTDQQIVIKADASLDQRVFNSPSSSQVTAIMLETLNLLIDGAEI